MTEPDKIMCDECKWHGRDADVLSAPNPFDVEDILRACPECLTVNELLRVCDEPGCCRPVSCGTPTADGYRSTCGEHRPK
jgi:hypothetical protein